MKLIVFEIELKVAEQNPYLLVIDVFLRAARLVVTARIRWIRCSAGRTKRAPLVPQERTTATGW